MTAMEPDNKISLICTYDTPETLAGLCNNFGIRKKSKFAISPGCPNTEKHSASADFALTPDQGLCPATNCGSPHAPLETVLATSLH